MTDKDVRISAIRESDEDERFAMSTVQMARSFNREIKIKIQESYHLTLDEL